MSAETGHILVHYLYTGAYQTLKSETSGTAPQPQPALKQALLVYRASVNHMLDGLEQLARQQIEEASASMDLNTFLDITRSEFPKKTEPSAWLQAYLKDKTQKAFEKDHTVFADDVFCASMCKKSKLNDFVMRHVVKLLSEKLTEALAGKGNIVDDMDELPRPQLAPEEIVADKDPFVGLSKGQREKLDTKMQAETLAEKGDITDELDELPCPQPVPETAADVDPFAGLTKKEWKKLEKKMKEELALIDPFAGLSKAQRKKLEKKMKEEKARLDEQEAEAAALPQYSYVNSDAPPAAAIVEEPAPVEETKACWEAPSPRPEPEAYYEVSIPAPEPEPCYDNSIKEAVTCWGVPSPPPEPEAYCEVSIPEPEPEPSHEGSMDVLSPIPEPEPEPSHEGSMYVVDPELHEEPSPTPASLKSLWVEHVPPARPKKETATAKKKRLAQEKKDKEKWDKEQQQNIDCEEKNAPCEEPEPLPEVPPELTPVSDHP
ncbi:hypothetical protein SLS60_008516 [Paraconiothyrium brasiliense]|uniref:Uncharacterized protein n=1 Tax=Paraconiothyrium brasiliense TaxID=300254 RepID=A0ABR3R0U0_9PLEO